MPFFSIIVPIYNVEQYLRQCLDSILSQSFQDFELILINDGSPDNSLSICEEYAVNYKNVIIIDQENKGLSGARNAGLEIAKGKYVWFVDSDDYITDNALEILFQNLQNYPDLIMFSNYHLRENQTVLIPNVITTASDVMSNKEFLNSGRHLEIAPWIYVYSLQFLNFEKLRFREDIKLHEDSIFIPEVFVKLKSILSIEDKLYVYRFRENSLMRSERTHDKLYSLYHIIQLFLSLRKEYHWFVKYCDNNIYSTLNMFFVQYNKVFSNLNSKQIMFYSKELRKIKLKIYASDMIGIKLMKILYNYCFPLYIYKLRR